MKRYLIALTLAACLTGMAQTAHVVALTPSESARLKTLTEQQEEITAQLAALKLEIVKTHLVVHDGQAHSGCAFSDGGYIAEGWGCEGLFEYSADFKFITPDPHQNLHIPQLGGGCAYLTSPATSTVSDLIYRGITQ